MKKEDCNDPYDPFNSMRILAWVDYWRQITEGRIPPPVSVSVDPANYCNHDCIWCNSASVKKRKVFMPEEYLTELAGFLGDWGVRSVCIGGGGETLINKYTGRFIDLCVEKGIEVGVITNGTVIHKHFESLLKCRWVGVSIDAANKKTHSTLHRTNEDDFAKIIDNVSLLCKEGSKKKAFEVGYKYLIHPANIGEAFEAAKLAKRIGARRFHCRPVSEPWYKKKNRLCFSQKDLDDFRAVSKKIKELNDSTFTAYTQSVGDGGALTYKYDKRFTPQHNFTSCHAIFLSCIFEPDGVISFCCDQRGNKKFQLCQVQTPSEILEYWGGQKHKAIAEQVDVKKCPRCSYAPHNEIFEKVIQEDAMMINFM